MTSFIDIEKLSQFLKERLKLVFWLAGALILAGAGAAGLFHLKNQKGKEAGEILYGYKLELEKAGKIANGENYNSKEPSHLFLPKEDIKYSDEMKTAAKHFEQALRAHKNHKISLYFAIELADFYFKSGQKNKARSLMELFLTPKTKKNLFTVYQLARLQLASFYMEDKLCEKTLLLLEGTVHDLKPGAFDTEIYLKQGICYEETNQANKAILAYQQIIDKDPESLASKRAKDYLLTLRLKESLQTNKEKENKANKP